MLDKKDYKSSLELLQLFIIPISNFFKNVFIKDKDELIFQNRMLLLQKTKETFDQIVKFDKL